MTELKLVVPQKTIKVLQSSGPRQPFVEVYPDTIDPERGMVMMYWSNNCNMWFTVPDQEPEEDILEWAAQWGIE